MGVLTAQARQLCQLGKAWQIYADECRTSCPYMTNRPSEQILIGNSSGGKYHEPKSSQAVRSHSARLCTLWLRTLWPLLSEQSSSNTWQGCGFASLEIPNVHSE